MLSLKLPKVSKLKATISFSINWLQANWMSVVCCFLLIYILVNKNITLQISLNNDLFTSVAQTPQQITPEPQTIVPILSKNKGFQPNADQLNYVRRFAKVAQGEMHKFGIPASITLAQGLLESGAGKSPLATKNNNHFGIKCFSRNCQKGHCKNFTDDSHKDFFRVYKTAWESYRAHSQFLQGIRYKHLLGETSYKIWANGLSKAGYATDKTYGKKLIDLIEGMELYRYDSLI